MGRMLSQEKHDGQIGGQPSAAGSLQVPAEMGRDCAQTWASLEAVSLITDPGEVKSDNQPDGMSSPILRSTSGAPHVKRRARRFRSSEV